MSVGQGLFSRPRPEPTPTGASGAGPGGSIHAAGPRSATPPGGSGTDPVTGLANRNRLFEQLTELRDAVLLVIDLDGFRTVNEVLGYDIGDEVLRECARRLVRTLPEGSTLSRIGDDEFAAALTPDVDPITWADGASAALRVPMMIKGRPHTVTASIGVATSNADGLAPSKLLRGADGALDRAKARGGDRLEVFDPLLIEQTRRRARIEQELRRGLQARQFKVYYQPQVSMTTGLIQGVEALVRWEHPVDGVISPGAFVPVAEETGLIRELGALVLRQACTDALTLLDRRRHEGRFTISVNVSSVQMQDNAFIQTVADVLADTGLDPAHLCIEVTESAVLNSSLRVESVLEQLRDFGVRFSIDDFGTGYSSLSYLRRLRVNELKIDRSFIEDMAEPRGRRMVSAICGIADALELETVAEGVDDAAAIAYLRGWGCDSVQGFLYFKPQPIEKVAKAVRRDKPRSLPDPV